MKINKPRWIHYHKLGMDTKYLPKGSKTTLCGKTAKSYNYDNLSITNQLSRITCPRCLKKLKLEGL